MSWDFIQQSLRATGRTTRMIEQAERLRRAGHAVYIIAANEQHAQFLRSLLPNGTTIKVEHPTSGSGFDWSILKTPGAHPNCRFLVDHYAIESWYQNILTELHRWDEPIAG